MTAQFLVASLIAFALGVVIALIIGQRTSRQLRHALHKRNSEMAGLQNEVMLLRENVRRSNHTIGKDSEDVLQRISADLHDGPMQKLEMALLKLDNVNQIVTLDGAVRSGIDETHYLLAESVRELSDLSSLLHMPEIATLDPADVARLAIMAHQAYTKTAIGFAVQVHPSDVRPEIKSCTYRFVQEALTNAFRHAKGAGQQVTIGGGVELIVNVSDNGPGLSWPDMNSGKLGLRGMRARIEALDGEFTIQNRPEGGLSLTARFKRPGV